MKYLIEGGQKLNGQIKISGNKNSILPCIAAALLTSDELILENVPAIADVEVFVEIFNQLGVKINQQGQTLKIKAEQIKTTTLPEDLVKKLRASLLLVGPLFSRMGQVTFYHPGGDIIGRRVIDVHLEGLKYLGASIKQDDLVYHLSKEQDLKGDGHFFMSFPSVTGTENLILASVIGQGTLEIRNATCEPHVIDLCNLLNMMGAKIEGIGTNTLKVNRVAKLSGASFRIGDDYLEIATYAIAAAITGGQVEVLCDPTTDLEPIWVVLEKFGLKKRPTATGFSFWADQLVSVDKVLTNIWPGFPTDLMSAVIVLATQAKGVTLCHDWMYESRMFFVDKLISMGANITIADPHRVLVYGPTALHGRSLETPDIRAGMALVLAALAAKGTSEIQKIELIERGYEDVISKLTHLGAKITKI